VLDAVEENVTNVRWLWVFFHPADVDDAPFLDIDVVHPPLRRVAITFHDPKR
jgi:hypothetical protein